ncbi:magnesium/cobalt transporter CorA [Paenibacillus glycinis]|uniref:Magnesium transport protein CorA n=1 Tax=Paenibacillus glycinis TaxID=2697035 RepID=A0ABW9XN33_9BACL|nr:magnesium/cobalt transporter CorA [Paenibacillus glycinis]NBD24032.1 magnesium/cobalt transporter CorA [Paenibacillus glycinis]
MIRIIAITDDRRIVHLTSLDKLADYNVTWYWADFLAPSPEEVHLLGEGYFHFHPLTIEDCLYYLQRPKMDHYDDVHFLVLHAMMQETMETQEVDLFIGPNYLVSYHVHPRREIERAREKIIQKPHWETHGCLHAAYTVIDELVDEYFPTAQAIEDQIFEFETGLQEQNIQAKLVQVFEIRNKLLKLRKTVVPMRELVYRILQTQRIEDLRQYHLFFTDIYDHLLKLVEIVDSNREMTSDLRDHYMSLSTNRMNTIMKTLTVITVIFMPLTFIAGIYGMNFVNMPELTWHAGYYAVLGVMAVLAVLMYGWFKAKGWFN